MGIRKRGEGAEVATEVNEIELLLKESEALENGDAARAE
jgi:hypothetical protein